MEAMDAKGSEIFLKQDVKTSNDPGTFRSHVSNAKRAEKRRGVFRQSRTRMLDDGDRRVSSNCRIIVLAITDE